MNYEHCWSYARYQTAYTLAWPDLIADTHAILKAVTAAGIHLAGPAGQCEPIADLDTGIVVNGDAARHENAQTFLLRPPTTWAPDQPDGDPLAVVDSCTTDRRPYDVAVTSILLRFALILPGTFTILSDGDWDGEWSTGASTSTNSTLAGTPGARTLVGDLFGSYPLRRPLA